MSGMSGMSGMGDMSGMAAMPGMARSSTSAAHHSMLLGMGAGASVAMWALMIVAMMLPTALPAVRHVAANSLRRRRPGAMATFAVVYLLIWVAFGALVIAVAPAWSSVDRSAVAAGALALAAAWQLHRAQAPGRSATAIGPRRSPPTGRRATARCRPLRVAQRHRLRALVLGDDAGDGGGRDGDHVLDGGHHRRPC